MSAENLVIRAPTILELLIKRKRKRYLGPDHGTKAEQLTSLLSLTPGTRLLQNSLNLKIESLCCLASRSRLLITFQVVSFLFFRLDCLLSTILFRFYQLHIRQRNTVFKFQWVLGSQLKIKQLKIFFFLKKKTT